MHLFFKLRLIIDTLENSCGSDDFFSITDLKIFSLCNVIQQIKKCGLINKYIKLVFLCACTYYLQATSLVTRVFVSNGMSAA